MSEEKHVDPAFGPANPADVQQAPQTIAEQSQARPVKSLFTPPERPQSLAPAKAPRTGFESY